MENRLCVERVSGSMFISLIWPQGDLDMILCYTTGILFDPWQIAMPLYLHSSSCQMIEDVCLSLLGGDRVGKE